MSKNLRINEISNTDRIKKTLCKAWSLYRENSKTQIEKITSF